MTNELEAPGRFDGEPTFGDGERRRPEIFRGPQVENTVEALRSLEPGESLLSLRVVAAVMKDVRLEACLEDSRSPNSYAIGSVWDLLEGIRTELLTMSDDSERERYLMEIEELRESVENLEERYNAANRKGKQGITARLRTELGRHRATLDRLESKARLIAESPESLRDDSARERLKKKAKEVEQLRRAVAAMDVLGGFYLRFTIAAFDEGKLADVAINPAYGRLSAEDLAALFGLPGFKEAIDIAMQVMLRLDIGEEPVIDGEPFMPGRKRNLCAEPGGINPQNREKFIEEFREALTRRLENRGIESAEFFAQAAISTAMAFHDLLFLSMVFDRPRDRETMEVIASEEEMKERTAGSMSGLLSTCGEKLISPGKKLIRDALSGYPAPYPTVIMAIVDRFLTDTLHDLKVRLEDLAAIGVDIGPLRDLTDESGKINAFDAILEGVGLSEIFKVAPEGFHQDALLGPFNAARLWKLLLEIPQEQIERISAAQAAIRKLAEWAADARKRMDGTLSRVYKDRQEALARSTINTINILVAAYWKMAARDPRKGGDSANEEYDTIGKARTQVRTYLWEQFSALRGILTPPQWAIVQKMTMLDRPRILTFENAREMGILKLLVERPRDKRGDYDRDPFPTFFKRETYGLNQQQKERISMELRRWSR